MTDNIKAATLGSSTPDARISARDRCQAVEAICRRATGRPDVAASEILAGIAVLDGQHLPILLWPCDTTREEKAAWHKSEAAYWDESARRFRETMERLGQSAEQSPALNPGMPPRPAPAPPPQDSASFAQAHLAAEIGNHPLPQSPEHD